MSVLVVGLGYVGSALAYVSSFETKTCVYDTDTQKIDNLNKGIFPIPDIEDQENHRVVGYTDFDKAIEDEPEFAFVCVPTNYDEETNQFDMSIVKSVCEYLIRKTCDTIIVIKSTVPIGFTDGLNKDLGTDRIIFSPEFMREGTSAQDTFYPSRIVVGGRSKSSFRVLKFLKSISFKNYDLKLITTQTNSEAEAVKLFANNYLAMRVAFFNELDSFAAVNGFEASDIIKGVCGDDRIGSMYNNPSFGYGGYCFPKDVKELTHLTSAVYNNQMISSIHKSNESRKRFIADLILESDGGNGVIGIYLLAMKANSDNFRSSAIIDIIDRLHEKSAVVVVYEPMLSEKVFHGATVINDLNEFLEYSDIVVANRVDDKIKDCGKLFTRSITDSDF